MTSPGKSLAVLIGCALTAAAAPPTAGLMPPGSPTAMSGSSMSPMGAMTSAGPSRIVVSEVVEPAFRDAVARVMGSTVGLEDSTHPTKAPSGGPFT